MRYLHRTHRVSVARLREAYQRKDFDLVYELTTRICADIYTKAFVDSGKWEAACELINIIDPKWLQKVISQRAAQDKESQQNEGGTDDSQRLERAASSSQRVSSARSREPLAPTDATTAAQSAAKKGRGHRRNHKEEGKRGAKPNRLSERLKTPQ